MNDLQIRDNEIVYVFEDYDEEEGSKEAVEKLELLFKFDPQLLTGIGHACDEETLVDLTVALQSAMQNTAPFQPVKVQPAKDDELPGWFGPTYLVASKELDVALFDLVDRVVHQNQFRAYASGVDLIDDVVYFTGKPLDPFVRVIQVVDDDAWNIPDGSQHDNVVVFNEDEFNGFCYALGIKAKASGFFLYNTEGRTIERVRTTPRFNRVYCY